MSVANSDIASDSSPVWVLGLVTNHSEILLAERACLETSSAGENSNRFALLVSKFNSLRAVEICLSTTCFSRAIISSSFFLTSFARRLKGEDTFFVILSSTILPSFRRISFASSVACFIPGTLMSNRSFANVVAFLPCVRTLVTAPGPSHTDGSKPTLRVASTIPERVL